MKIFVIAVFSVFVVALVFLGGCSLGVSIGKTRAYSAETSPLIGIIKVVQDDLSKGHSDAAAQRLRVTLTHLADGPKRRSPESFYHEVLAIQGAPEQAQHHDLYKAGGDSPAHWPIKVTDKIVGPD